MMKKALLWQLTPPQGGPDSYLFGTIHLRVRRVLNLIDFLEPWMKRCSVFAAEFNFEEADEAAFSNALSLPFDCSLRELLSRSAWKNLDRISRIEMGRPAVLFNFMHPMAVTALLTASAFREDAEITLDEHLAEHAGKWGLISDGAEDFDAHLSVIDSIPLNAHVHSLQHLLRNYGRERKRLHKMLEQYLEGDIAALYRNVKRNTGESRKVLLYHRNVLMAEKLSELARRGPTFCAVGAAHLAGGKGMLRLLKHQGFRINAVEHDRSPA